MPYARSAEALKAYRTLKRREPNGQIQRPSQAEKREDMVALAFTQPHRRNLPKTWKDDDGKQHPVHPDDKRAGYALGRLCLAGQINEAQLHTGNKAGERLKAYIAIRTPGGLGFGAQDFNRSSGSSGDGAEMAETTIARIRENMAEISHALQDTSNPAECLEALVMTCALDEDVRRHDVMGFLRDGLNVLQRAWDRPR
jgi:hypothetical protein